MRFILHFFLFNFFFINLTGQSSGLRFISLSTEDGLSNNTVTCILQDSQGFMWFGTEDGLNRYDGYSFTIYRHNPIEANGLINNNISCLIQDENGTIWIGTKGGGLNRYDPTTDLFSFFLHDPDDSSSLCSNEILSMYEDRSGQLWIGTDGGGISRYDRENDRFLNYGSSYQVASTLSSNEILSIGEDNLGNMWFGTWEGGLNVFDKKREEFIPCTMNVKEDFNILTDNVWTIFPYGQDQMWIGMWGGGFGLLDTKNNAYNPLLFDVDNQFGGVNNTWAVYQDLNGVVWVGTDMGLHTYFPETREFLQYLHNEDNQEGISSNKVLCIYEDKDQAKWIGTDNGINAYFPDQKKFTNFQITASDGIGLTDNYITAVLQDHQGNTWIGTEKGGLNKYISQDNSIEHFENVNERPGTITGGRINTLYIDSMENLWVGTRYGLSKYDRISNTFTQYHFAKEKMSSANEVLDVCEGPESMMWVGTDDGLYKLNTNTGSYQKYSSDGSRKTGLNSNHILSLHLDNTGTLWIGSWKGINKYDEKSDSFESYINDFQNSNSLSNNYVHTIFQDHNNNLWFGTRGGLNRFDALNKRFINYRETDGLANDVIYGILEDDRSNLWLSTNHGLSRFNTDSLLFKNFDIHDGIQGNQFSMGACFRNNSGTMFFGGTNGLSIFHPDSISENKRVPEVWITELYINSVPVNARMQNSPLDKHISETKQIVLSYKQKDLSFDFVALNYLASSKNQYAYKLDGLGEDPYEWAFVGTRRTAYYTNIPPGEYVFRVIASNNDNLWNETGASLSITIEPPFWSTTWFKFMVILSLYAIAYSLFRLRMYRIKLQNRVLESQVEERTSEVVRQKENLSIQAENLRKANKSIASKNIQLEEHSEKIRTQAEEIYRMNELLKKDNINLEENVRELSKARVMQKRVSFTEFKQIYPDIESCNRFLFELKDQKGYACLKCTNTSFSIARDRYSRRCSKCGYNESVTVGTIFYRIKFPIDKAFYILYLVSMGRELTVDELAGLISLRRETCWAFRNKVMGVMKKRKRFKNPREGWKELILNSK